MKALVIMSCCLLTACSTMTPSQRKWAAVGVSVVATGLIIAHEQDSGRGALSATENGKGRRHPSCTGDHFACK